MQNQSSPVGKMKNQFYRAGAGAGKTTALIQNCIDFLNEYKKDNGVFPRIIITTFTSKATQEIKERLTLKALQQNDQMLFQHINKKSMVQIGTLHGILNIFLKKNIHLLGFSSNFKIVDDSVFQFEIKRILKSLIFKNDKYQKFLDFISFDKLAVVLNKSLNLISEYSQMSPIPLDKLKKISSEELKTKIDYINEFLDNKDQYPEKWSENINFIFSLKEAVLKKDYKLIEELYSEKPKKFILSRKNPEISEELNNFMSLLYKDNVFSPLDFENDQIELSELNVVFYELTCIVLDQLHDFKKRTHQISIADLEFMTLKIIEKWPESGPKFSSQYHLIMVDEFQDTSPLQVKILNSFMSADPYPLNFIVGDPQQSIYLFRGARSEVFMNKEAEMNRQGIQTQLLMKNYRSQPRLMAFINFVFNHFSEQFKPLEPKLNDFTKKNTHQLPEVRFISVNTNEHYAILDQIKLLHSKGISFDEITVLFKRNKDIIEFSKTAHKFNLPVQVQISKGFENRPEILDLVFFLKFLINPFDNDNLIALLRAPWFEVSDDDIIGIRNLNPKIPLWSVINDKSLLSKSQLNQKIVENLVQQLTDLLDFYNNFGASATVLVFFERFNILFSSYFYDPTTVRESNLWKFLQLLEKEEKLSSFNLTYFCNQFLNSMSLSLNSDLSSSSGDGIPIVSQNRVSLMTIHGSKGLQFCHVIIPGFNQQVKESRIDFLTFDESNQYFCLKYFLSDYETSFSSRWSEVIMKAFTQRQLDENDRLLYVAMTRAKESLCLIKKESKNIPKNSWLEKMNWSSDFYQSEQFTAIFDEVDSFETFFENKINKNKEIKNKLLFRDAQLSISSPHVTLGITEFIETRTVSSTSKIDQKLLSNDRSEKLLLDSVLKANSGTRLHRYFEGLQYVNIEQFAKFLTVEDLSAVNWMLKQNQVPLLNILKQGFIEWGFGLRVKNQNLKDELVNQAKGQIKGQVKGQVKGQIDAWGIVDGVVYVIDYKTGQKEYKDKALLQLRFYAWCLVQMKKIRAEHQITLVVIYPLDQHIISEAVSFKELSEVNLLENI